MINNKIQQQAATLSIDQILQQAITHHQAGQLHDAERLYHSILHNQPDHADTKHNLNVLTEQIKQAAISLPHFKSALETSPDQAQHWLNYIDALILTDQIDIAQQILQLGQQHGLQDEIVASLAERLNYGAQRTEPLSKQSYTEKPPALTPVIAKHSKTKKRTKHTKPNNKFSLQKEKSPSPQQIDVLVNLFMAARYTEVITHALQMTTDFPHYGYGWKILGAALKQAGRIEDALLPMQKAVKLSPFDPETHNNLGITLMNQGRLEKAKSHFQHALELKPDYVIAFNHLSHILQKLGLFVEAEACCRRMLVTQPDYAPAYLMLGNIIEELGQLSEAEICCRQALEIKPDYEPAYLTLGYILQKLGRLNEAEACYREALKIKPDYAEAYNNLGNTLKELSRLAEAESCFRHALEIKPDYAEAHNNLGGIFKEQCSFDKAATCFRQSLQLQPNYTEAHNNLGNILKELSLIDEAEACYRQSLQLQPDFEVAFSNLLFVLNYHPDKTAEEIFEAYQEYEAKYCLPHHSEWLPHNNNRNPHRRLKVGYVSPDFRKHSAQYFLEPLIVHHDKKDVEIYAYAELAVEDSVASHYKSYVDQWIPTRGMSNAALAERIRADCIDILVDLAGHTAKNRLSVFARKPAPVSVSWLGYGYTTGLTAIDYFLTDIATVPQGSEALFSETPYQVATPSFSYHPAEGMGKVNDLPALTNGYITFGTLTRTIRLNHRTIKAWSEILKCVPDSRLVIDCKAFSDEYMQDLFAEKFVAHGISRERLEFGYHTPPWDVLRGIDIGLDCFPHNSGTTLFETLYMGIPYITLAGRPSVGRLGSCILQGLGRPEWIAESEADYVAKAVELAGDTNHLSEIRTGLRNQMENSPLRDEKNFALKIEAAYRDIWKIWCQKNHNIDDKS